LARIEVGHYMRSSARNGMDIFLIETLK